MGWSGGRELTVGEAVRLLPLLGGRLMRGRVVAVLVDADSGRARATVLPRAGTGMDGARVWVIAGDSGTGSLTVYEGRLHVTDRPDEVELAELDLLADEPRRSALRAGARRPVLLLRPGKASRGTTSIDLSSTGCRVSVPPDQDLAAGQSVQVAVDLDAGRSVWADGEVVWVDPVARVAALRFIRVDPADSERLDRGVLAALSPHFGRHSPPPA
jgi:PilZ domain